MQQVSGTESLAMPGCRQLHCLAAGLMVLLTPQVCVLQSASCGAYNELACLQPQSQQAAQQEGEACPDPRLGKLWGTASFPSSHQVNQCPARIRVQQHVSLQRLAQAVCS